MHNPARSMKDNHTCPLCGVLCTKYESYRDHLMYIHGQSGDSTKLTFKYLNDFLIWKSEEERIKDCNFALQSVPKILSSGNRLYYYQCDFLETRLKKEKMRNTVVKKIESCPAMISVIESDKKPQVQVEYWATHAGHIVPDSPFEKDDELTDAISSVRSDKNADNEPFSETFDASCDDTNMVTETAGNHVLTETLVFNNRATNSFTVTQQVPSLDQISNHSKIFNSKAKSITKKRTSEKRDLLSSSLYSLASVACGKVSKKSKITEKDKVIDKNSSENSDKTSNPTEPEKNNIQSSSSAEGDETVSAEITSSKVDLAVASKDSSSTTNLNVGHGRPLFLLNTLPMKQNILNANAVSSGQNVLLCPVPQNVLPLSNTGIISNPVLHTQSGVFDVNNTKETHSCALKISSVGSVCKSTEKKASSVVAENIHGIEASASKLSSDPKPGCSGKKISSVVTEKMQSAGKKTAFPRKKKVKLSEDTRKQDLLGGNKTKEANVVNSQVSAPSTSNDSNAQIVLGNIPPGMTFMRINNSLIPVRNASGTYLTNLHPTLTALPTIPNAAGALYGYPPVLNLAPLNSVRIPAPISKSSQVSAKSPNVGKDVKSILSSPATVSAPATTLYGYPPVLNITPSTPVIHTTVSNSPSLSLKSATTTTTTMASSSTVSDIRTALFGLPPVLNIAAPIPVNISSALPNSKVTAQSETIAKSVMNTLTSPNKASVVPNALYSFPPVLKLTPSFSVSTSTTLSSSQMYVQPPAAADFKTLPSTAVTKSIVSNFSLSPIQTEQINQKRNAINKSGHNEKHANGSEILNGTAKKSGKAIALQLEMSDDIYILEPIENSVEESDMSCQKSGPKSGLNLQKGNDPQTDFKKSAVSDIQKTQNGILQNDEYSEIEAKYIACQEECKRLKFELIKARLNNKEIAFLMESNKNLDNRSDSEMCMEISYDDAQSSVKVHENLKKDDADIYAMIRTSVLRSLYADMKELCEQNEQLSDELENYRLHDRFYKALRQRMEEQC
ncbi:mucin-5AC-like isoform X2 [Stegodyphus dumicola]|nr:mucin-5AC-like isoform X2 [Stegodyphus dumicola]